MHNNKLPKILVKITSIILFAFSASAFALTITIEPDDYALGTDLSNISPYVTLQYAYEGAVPGMPDIYPVKSANPSPFIGTTYPAPTGDQVFSGQYGYGFLGGTGGNGPTSRAGLALIFHQQVSHVSLFAQSAYSNMGIGLGVSWAAFDQNNDFISQGTTERFATGSPFLIDLHIENMWSIVLGGEFQIDATTFDHLTFEIQDETPSDVPVPASVWLFGSSLVGLAGVARRRK